MKSINKAILLGFLGSFSLLAFYFLIMLLGKNSFLQALNQLNNLRLWIIPLIITFGIEVGLFAYLKSSHQVSRNSTMVSTATSTTAMIACCAHHVTDILPFVGLSVFATFLTAFQPWFLAIGIISNSIAIFFLARQLPLSIKTRKQSVTFLIFLTPLILVGFGYLMLTGTNGTAVSANQVNKLYPLQENNEKGVTVSVTPEKLSFSENVVFNIAMNNHMYDLSIDLGKATILKDDKGNIYKPLSWEGTSGGHHVSGRLLFPHLLSGASSITLVLPGIVGVDRTFLWNL